jgi:uracil-DNA glycosylase
MAKILDPQLRSALSERVRFCHEMGIYDFYRRDFYRHVSGGGPPDSESVGLQTEPVDNSSALPKSHLPQPELEEEMARKSAAVVTEEPSPSTFSPRPEDGIADPATALRIIRQDLGDCIRCRLSKDRNKIVFGVGDPHAELMFVGEGPGADEDAQGEPFVGRAGQLLNNMIKAMGLRREDVYIANIVKCRPPGNRQPERDEADTCSPFLMRQISAIKPKVLVALGATAAKNLLAMNAPMTELRGRWYDFKPAGGDPAWPGSRLAVTYHPAFLLRDPRQKGEAWKDLQMVMKYLGIEPPKKSAE